MRRSIFVILLPFCLLLAACNLNDEGAAVETIEPLLTAEVEPAAAATNTVSSPTNTPMPTSTTVPTNTTGGGNTNTNTPNCTPRQDWTTTYTVVSGDTLGQIAQRTGSSVTDLSAGNCLSNPNAISVGQTLRVPRAPTSTGSSGGTVYERYPNLPRVGDVAGMPSQEVCWISNPSGGVLVYAQPQQPESAAIGVLSNRALLAEIHNAGYYRIEFAEQINGGTGWVKAEEVNLIGGCGDGPGLGPPPLPVHQDPGSPPTNACVAVHPGGTAEVIIYNPAPGQGMPLPVAMLGNWAEVKTILESWYEVILGPNETGWIPANIPNHSPTLMGDCSGLQ